MSDVSAWNPLDSDNTAPPPDGWPEFMQPSMVNNTGRMMMGAVRRMYDGLAAGSLVLPYLKLAGGQTVTGAVTFSAGLTATAITSNGTINAASTISTSGAVSAAGNVSGGSISTGGAISGNSLVANAITSNGALAAASYDMAGAALARVSGASTLLYDRANNWCIQLDNGGGSNYANNTHHFYSRGMGADYGFWNSGGLTVYASLAVSGAISANSIGANYIGSNGNINAAGTYTGGAVSVGTVSATNGNISGTLTLADTGHQIMADGGSKYYQFQAGWNWSWNRSNGTLTWTGSTAFWNMRTTDWLCYNAIGTVGGMGDYYNGSDLRFKDASSIGPATAGLDAILQLQPVRFKRMARSFAPSEPSVTPPIPRWEIGFIAQEVQDIIPEAVAAVGIELPDGTGGPGDPEPTLAIGNTALVAALVNAIKTINQRLTDGGL